ncbi:MAG: response regulator transcription factor [Actinomycetota bacterium]
MAMVSTNFQQPQSETRQVAAITNHSRELPVCVIYSKHPLALSLIKDAVCSDAGLAGRVKPYANGPKLPTGEKHQILVLDTCSVDNWPICLSRWQAEGGLAIALVSAEPPCSDLELHLVYQGVAGVLTFAELHDHLAKAIRAVAEGRLWFRREVLYRYVNQTSNLVRNCCSANQKLTAREREILDLLLQDLPNRRIAQRLAVSVRTIKFHVSNILRKLRVGSRRELRDVASSSASFMFDRPGTI